MPEGEKHWGAILIGGDNLPSPGWNRLTDQPNMASLQKDATPAVLFLWGLLTTIGNNATC